MYFCLSSTKKKRGCYEKKKEIKCKFTNLFSWNSSLSFLIFLLLLYNNYNLLLFLKLIKTFKISDQTV